MARLAIDKDFLDDYSKLPELVQNNVKTAIEKFAEHVHVGIHLEKLSHSKDDRIRTIRIDQFWRGVVLAPDSGGPAQVTGGAGTGKTVQRIYDSHVSLARIGINVRGRSKRLTVNYRTTQEILALAVPALGKLTITGLDDEADSLAGY